MTQLIAETFGAGVMVAMGGYYLYSFAPPAELRQYHSLFQWLASSPLKLPFLIVAILFLLAALAWFTVALINLFGDSPFNYLVVDRHGLSYRNFWGEKRFSWKDIGPIQALRLSRWRSSAQQLRYWIAADSLGTEAGGGLGLWRFGGPSGANLRIPASTYVGGGWLIGSLSLATDSAAAWLEELRQAARQDRLESEAIPEPPYNFRKPVEIAYDQEPAPRAPGGESSKSKNIPTVER